MSLAKLVRGSYRRGRFSFTYSDQSYLKWRENGKSKRKGRGRKEEKGRGRGGKRKGRGYRKREDGKREGGGVRIECVVKLRTLSLLAPIFSLISLSALAMKDSSACSE